MKKFEVGYEDEYIGIYYGKDKLEAIHNCKMHMKENNFKPETSSKVRLLQGMIANEVDY